MSRSQAHPQAHTGGVPRGLLAAAGALVLFTFLASGLSRLTDIGAVHMPVVAPAATLQLRFQDQPDGGVAVIDSKDGKEIYRVQPGSNGFIRATIRGLTRERLREGVGEIPPFALTRWSDGTLSLEDSSIKRRIDLDAFGPTNSQAFAQFFAARSQTP